MARASAVLRDTFGHAAFRPGQRDVVRLLLAPPDGAPARALAVFPTGAGKSLTYQLPALVYDAGITLVVSPLLALMRDQTTALVAKGVAALSLDSTLDAQAARDAFDALDAGRVKLLFVAPERFKNERFLRLLRRLSVALFVVDEAHCISEWGHSFRPDYLRLARYADELGFERRLALTATATPRVAEDIARSLSIPFPACYVRTPFARPNLTTAVTLLPSQFGGTRKGLGDYIAGRVDVLAERIKSRPPGATIVYVTLQATAMAVAEMLRKHGVLETRAYHAGVSKDERKAVQDWFMASADNECAVVVATIAFGMGIDKSNIRYVYHANLPKSLESYSQEIGRAGRDGNPSTCEVLACVDDLPTLEAFALGATPTRLSIERFVSMVLEGKQIGDTVHVSVYDASHELDIRDVVLNQMLAQLDLNGGYLRETTPFYGILKCRKKSAQAYNTFMASNSRASKILEAGTGNATIRTLDVLKIAESLNMGFGAISREMDDLVRSDVLASVAPMKIHSQFIITRVPSSLEDVVEMLFKAAKRMEQQELKRLDEVVSFLSASSCQTKLLCERFGDDGQIEEDCGHCAFCCNGCRAALTIDDEQRARVGRKLDERRWALIQAQDYLPADNPILMARFAAGISSPVINKNYKKLPGFGSMSDHSFGTLVDAAKKECARRL